MANKYTVTNKHMIKYRALLMLKLERDIRWNEFYKLIGIAVTTAQHLRSGKRGVHINTSKKIVANLREHGIIIHLSDFLE